MADEREEGKFQGMVLAKLDALAAMGMDIQSCLKDHEKRIKALEHTAVQARLIGLCAGLLGSKLTALLGLK